MDQRRITVRIQPHGEQEVTKGEFIQQWGERFKEFLFLASIPDEIVQLQRMREDIEELASSRFEHLYKEHHARS